MTPFAPHLVAGLKFHLDQLMPFAKWDWDEWVAARLLEEKVSILLQQRPGFAPNHFLGDFPCWDVLVSLAARAQMLNCC